MRSSLRELFAGRRAPRVLCIVAGVLFFLAASWRPARAAEEADKNPHLWQPRTKSVAVFKNGLGFFMREGDVTLRDGWCIAREVPPAAFGTLAIHATRATETVDIVGSGRGEMVSFDDRDAASDMETKRARLAACEHLKVQLEYRYKGENRSAAGTLVSVGEEFAVLDSGTNSYAVPVADVTQLQVLEFPLRIHVLQDESTEPGPTTLGMAYLRHGITWVPEYTLKMLDGETAELSLRGTLINEAEDLIHTDVHFVVGVPHFVHSDMLAPVAIGQTIRRIGAAVAPQAVMSQMMQNAAVVNSLTNSATTSDFHGLGIIEQPIENQGGSLSGVLGNLPQLDNTSASDFTVYTKEGLTLRRGEKAIVTLFRKTIKFSRVYRWSPPDAMRHLLVLHNDTDTAWTTGPCLALSQERPLSEDLLKYTPKGGKAELPMTSAINISHERSEEEVDRQLKAHNPYSNEYWDLVTLQGTLSLRSFETESVDIVISNAIPGKPTAASDDGRMVTDSTKLKLVEREGAITWRVTLQPGESKAITYKYERYVPSR